MEEAITFWAGCGAIRKGIFLATGGFNERKYPHPSIEDIELGLRLWQKHHPVRLDKRLQVKHLKHWNWFTLLKADILYRAYPWSNLILESSILPDDLNLQFSHRISAILAGTLVVLIPFLVPAHRWFPSPTVTLIGFAIVLIMILFVILNRHLYQFFFRQHGFAFALFTIPWHLFYYCYSGVTFAVCWFQYKLKALFSFAKEVSGKGIG